MGYEVGVWFNLVLRQVPVLASLVLVLELLVVLGLAVPAVESAKLLFLKVVLQLLKLRVEALILLSLLLGYLIRPMKAFRECPFPSDVSEMLRSPGMVVLLKVRPRIVQKKSSPAFSKRRL